MNEYKIPEQYYFRIHHVRPRFKGDVENVLIYIAEELVKIGEKEKNSFINEINNSVVPEEKIYDIIRDMKCERCKNENNQIKSGRTKAGNQKYKCKHYGSYFQNFCPCIQ